MSDLDLKHVATHGEFDEILDGATPEMTAIARRLREIIAGAYPGAYEVPWPRQRIAGYGVGPKKMSQHFSYIAMATNHVNLGFYYGAHLEDPEGLMEGTGKNLRHVKVRSVHDADHPPLKRLLKLAVEERLPYREPE